MIDLSLIMVSYNNLSVLKDCIQSIKKYNDIGNRLEIIVVEQSPENEIYDYLISNNPEIVTIRNSNEGFGCGNNLGARHAKGKYLLFLNTDTILIEPIFSFAINLFENDSDLGEFGLQLVNRNIKQSMSFEYKYPFGAWRRLFSALARSFHLFDPNRMYISGADIFIRRDLFDLIQGFDKNIFMYCEDAKICDDVLNAGKKVKYFKEKRIIHLHGQSTSSVPQFLISKSFLKSYRYYCDVTMCCYSKQIQKQARLYGLLSILYHCMRNEKKERLYKENRTYLLSMITERMD